MRCVFDPRTDLHAPEFFLARGRLVPNEERAERARRLLTGLETSGLSTEPPAPVDTGAIERVHTQRYLDFLKTAWHAWQDLPNAGSEVIANVQPTGPAQHYPDGIVGRAGWHMADTACPIGQHSWSAALAAAQTSLGAADIVAGGAKAAYALCRPPGHHAFAEKAGGHCLLNNAAIAAEHLASGQNKVAILDIDVHHGNGTQGIFWTRPDVLCVSVHADPSSFYPFFSGYDHETGAEAGAGHTLNLPLPRGSGDGVWLDAITTALETVQRHAPSALVLSLGLDAHEHDPLGGLRVTTPAFFEAARLIAQCDLPTVLVQEGGYLSDDLTLNLSSFMNGWLSIQPHQGAHP